MLKRRVADMGCLGLPWAALGLVVGGVHRHLLKIMLGIIFVGVCVGEGGEGGIHRHMLKIMLGICVGLCGGGGYTDTC